MKRVFFRHLALLATCMLEMGIPCDGQTGTLSWTHRFQSNGDNTDRFSDVADYNGNGFVATGFSVKKGNYRDVLTARLSPQGDTLWWRTKNGAGNGNDFGTSVATDFFGNVYVAGTTDNGNSQDDIYLLKYDATGNLIWDTTWNSSAFLDDATVSMELDGSGNIIVAGNVEPDAISGSENICVLKFNSNGGLLWQAIYDNAAVIGGKDEASDLVLDAAGNAYVCGRSFGATSDYDFITMKVDGSTGSRTWTMIYNNTVVNGDDRATSICLDYAGNVIVTGRSDNGNDDDIRTIKYEPVNGILQWTRFYAGSLQQNDRGIAVTVDDQNNIYVAGQTDMNSSTLTNYDYIVLKYNSAGTIQWNKVSGNTTAMQSDIPVDIAVKGSTRVVVTGYSDTNTDPNLTYDAIWTVCYSTSNGTQLWQDVLTGTRLSSDNQPSRIFAVNSDNLVRIAGFLENSGTQGDALFLTYDTVGVRVSSKSHNGAGDFTSNYSDISALTPIVSQSVAVGYSYEEGQEKNALLQLLSSGGQPVCDFLYNGLADEDDQFNALAVDQTTSPGMVYAAGYTKTPGQKSDFLLVKFNPSACDTVWTRTYNFTSNQTDRLVDVVVDNSGNIYVTGYSDAAANDTLDNLDIVTMKYSSAGALLWVQRFDGTGLMRDEPVQILMARNGNVLVCGRTENAQNDDMILIRYDQNTGNPVWATPAVYNSSFSNDDRALSMAVDGNDNVFLSGYSQTGQGASTDDAVVVRVDPQGAVGNVFNYDGTGSGNDQAVSVTTDASNTVYLAVRSDRNSDPLLNDYGIVIFSLSNSLSAQNWTSPTVITSPLGADATPVELVYFGTDLYLAGYADYSSPITNDILLARISTAGQLSWLRTYDGPATGEDESSSMAFDGVGLLVAGNSEGLPTGQSDAIVLEYSLPAGVSEYASDFRYALYPNPSTGFVSWTLEEEVSAVSLYDATGRLVFGLEGLDVRSLDLSDIPAGMYRLVLNASSGSFVYPLSIISHD